jgi:phosphoenolpyruvate carboxylase
MMSFRNKTSFIKKIGHKELMENYPDGIASIRESVLYCHNNTAICFVGINELNKESVANEDLIKVYEKL